MKKIILLAISFCLILSGCYVNSKVITDLEDDYKSLSSDFNEVADSYAEDISSHSDLGYNSADKSGNMFMNLKSGATIEVLLYMDESSNTKYTVTYSIDLNGYNTDVAYLNVPSEDRELLCSMVNAFSRETLGEHNLNSAIEIPASVVESIKDKSYQEEVHNSTESFPNMFVPNIKIEHQILSINPETSSFIETVNIHGEIK